MSENAFYPVFLAAALLLVLVLESADLAAAARAARRRSGSRTRRASRRSRSCPRSSPRRCCSALLRGGAGGRRCARSPTLYAGVGGAGGARPRCAARRAAARRPTCSAPTASSARRTTTSARCCATCSTTGRSSTSTSASSRSPRRSSCSGSPAGSSRGCRRYLAGAVAVAFWLVLVVAAFASEFAVRIQERNDVRRRAALPDRAARVGRARRAAAAAARASARRPGARCSCSRSRSSASSAPSATSDTLMLLPWWSVQDTTGLEWIAELAFALAVGARGRVRARAAAVRASRCRSSCSPTSSSSFKPIWSGSHGLKQASAGALFQGIRGDAARLDRRRPCRTGAEVDVLWTGRADRFTVNLNEFFNRSVGDILYTDSPTPGGIGEQPVADRPATGVVRDGAGRPVRAAYVLDRRLDHPGRRARIERDALLGTTLWEVGGELVSTTRVRRPVSGGHLVRAQPSRGRGCGAAAATRASRSRATPRSSRADGSASSRRHRRSRRRTSIVFRSDTATTLRVPLPRAARTLRRPLPRHADGAAGDAATGESARRTLQRLRLPPAQMRIVVDVSPLSHPLAGIGNYIRGSLARPRRRGGRVATRSSPSRPRACAGRSGSERRCGVSTSSFACGRCPPLTRCALGGASAGGPPPSDCSGSFDVLHFSDWMYPPQRAGCGRRPSTTSCRCASPSG